MISKKTKEYLEVGLGSEEAAQDIINHIDSIAPLPPPPNFSPSETQSITLTDTDIQNGFIALPHSPASPSAIAVSLAGGTSQVYGLDFILNNNALVWVGLGLETILDSGDVLCITYNY